MARPIRIFQLAKELNIPHTEIVSFLKGMGVDVASHMSPIDEEAQALIMAEFSNGKEELIIKKGKSSNFNPNHENYYTRLGLDENASSAVIKRAFFKAVKTYPPEKDPENQKLIREAYDTLAHSISRYEYDSRKEFGDLLANLEINLNGAVEDEDIDEQIRILKKILNIAPKLGMYRNKLGLAFMEKEQFEYAFAQFQKAHTNDPENSVYILNMGHAETDRGNYKEAETLFNQSWDLDKEDYSAPRALASLYFEKLNNKSKAHAILDEAIEADSVLNFQDFFCIFDKVHFYALDHNHTGLKKELERVKEISSKNEEKEFAAFMLYRTGGQLFDLKVFDLSVQFLKTAHALLPADSEIKNFYLGCKKQTKLIKSIKKALKDNEIHDLSKSLLAAYAGRYYGELTDKEFEVEFKKVTDILSSLLDTQPMRNIIENSFRYIKQHYKDIYNIMSSTCDQILDFPPASKFADDCPHCGNMVRIEIYDYGRYDCPHCYKKIKYDSQRYSKGGFFDW